MTGEISREAIVEDLPEIYDVVGCGMVEDFHISLHHGRMGQYGFVTADGSGADHWQGSASLLWCLHETGKRDIGLGPMRNQFGFGLSDGHF